MTVTNDDIKRIHDRLDDIAKGMLKVSGVVSKVSESVSVVAAKCEDCRKIVMGTNGRKSIDTRVVALETIRGIKSKGFWAVVAFAAAVISASIGFVGSLLAGALF